MAITLLWNLQNLWPFSTFKSNQLKSSKQLVNKLNISDHTKQFVFALRDPKTQSLIYILSSLNLSERSSFDAKSLISEIKPDAVIVQSGAAVSPFDDDDDVLDFPVPISSFGVIKRCFVDKIGTDKYESVAGDFVLREIFGTGFNGPLLAAKKAAENVGSTFIVVQSPLGTSCLINNNNDSNSNSNDNDSTNSSGGVDAGNGFRNIGNSLVPQQQGAASLASIAMKRFSLNKDVRMVLAEGLSGYMDPLLVVDSKNDSVLETGKVEIQPTSSYETPAFAKPIYPLLEDLHEMFSDLPSMGKALGHVQKMLLDVNRGEVLDAKTVSEVYTFRIAVEGLRIALNNKGMRQIVEKDVSKSKKFEFSELPADDKSQVLFAQAIRSQTDKFKTIVAVVDASALAGIRKHWDTPLPGEIKEIVGELIMDSDGKGVSLNPGDKKRLLADRPVVAVGAGATAVLGASSLTKVVPMSTLTKIVTLKTPASLKIVLSQMQKLLSVALGPSKFVPGFATSGAKTPGIMKAAASAEKIRAVTHSVIASAEKTSVSAMRTAFYEIMRKRKIQRIGFLPWATFAGSIGTCTGLLLYGDGIECAIESVPAAPSIASLGRGIQNLREASQVVMQTEGTRVQKSIESLVNKIRKARDQ
ncbi:uncharacterized protein LOC123917656 [Trifolium pratense]|uniref:uncharacterized protein LOC123917656 n=1 Tax=Trifolium pratense TaxID=57577 RepID=UPI001E694A4E|nr:uncharacterized protein LOC123917656 [Trifolium pratense]